MEGLGQIPDSSVHCVVTSPPYWGLRDYGYEGQIGSEKTPHEFVCRLVDVFCGVKRVLRDDGVLFLNLGDSYATGGGSVGRSPGGGDQGQRFLRAGMINTQPNRMNFGMRSGNAIGIPWRVAFALQEDGWILRSEIIWAKTSPMPESVSGWRFRDGALKQGSWRPTKSHEQIFMFTKSSTYFCDGDGSKEPAVRGAAGSRFDSGKTGKRSGGDRTQSGPRASDDSATRNMRSVWRISSESYKEAHFATYPTELVRRCLIAGTSRGGCCSLCGKQFAPVVTTERVPTRPGHNSKVNRVSDDEGSPYERHSGSICGNRDPNRHSTVTKVHEYLPTCGCAFCDCEASDTSRPGWVTLSDKSVHQTCCSSLSRKPARPVVLDPFGGSMTTGQVAINMGCEFIGIEANSEYAELGVKRLQTPWAPKSERSPPKPRRRKNRQQRELFQ
ncbi:DNA-methyltransferase [Schlesneria sp. T3-172]|uniref:DNA-methyltransferase n=1 Tax=Schlesneria sphaerica TaxID=3373610 RepID=UPI0037C50FAE